MTVRAAQEERTELDPIVLEIIRHGLQSIPDEIESDISRTAYSPLIYEYKDYAVGLVDPEGRLISQCKGGIPVFMSNVLGLAVLDGIECYGLDGMAEGDVFISNWAGTFGQHLNNVSMYTPIIVDDEIVAFMAVLVHWMDVGGRYVGSSASNDTTDIFQEGIQFRSIKLRSCGGPVAETYRMIEYNTRFPEMVLGDLAAQLAACMKGRGLYKELLARHGLTTVNSAIQLIWQQSAATATALVRGIPDGEYEARSFLDDDGITIGERIPLHVIVRKRGENFTVDFSDMPGQCEGPFNSGRLGGGIALARLAFKYLTTPDERTNEGSYAPLEVILPDGKLISAGPTAAMARYSTPFPIVIDSIIAAMAGAMPDRVAAAHHGEPGSHRFQGRLPNGRLFSHLDTAHGGWGASNGRDGPGPFKTMLHADTRDVPVESQEALYPIRVDYNRLRLDSGGVGEFRGGLGLEKGYSVLGPCKLTVTFVRNGCPAWGLLGGGSGASATVEVVRANGERSRYSKVCDVPLDRGDRVFINTGGGGGYGLPQKRKVASVARDVRCRYVSVDAARLYYGVAIDQEGVVDGATTHSLRRAMDEGK